MISVTFVAVVALSLCSLSSGSNDVDPELSPQQDDYPDYNEIYEIRQLCSRKWGVDAYAFSVFYYPDDEVANRSVMCGLECEMKARKFIGDNGELFLETFTEEYYKEQGVKYNNFTKKMADYVLLECSRQWGEEEDSDSCTKAFKFQKCIAREQQDYYSRNNVKNCLYSLQSKNISDYEYQYGAYSSGCITMAAYCYMDIQNYIQRKGVNYFESVVEETGLLESNPVSRSIIINNMEHCHNLWVSDKEDCHRDLKLFTCVVATLRLVVDSLE